MGLHFSKFSSKNVFKLDEGNMALSLKKKERILCIYVLYTVYPLIFIIDSVGINKQTNKQKTLSTFKFKFKKIQ